MAATTLPTEWTFAKYSIKQGSQSFTIESVNPLTVTYVSAGSPQSPKSLPTPATVPPSTTSPPESLDVPITASFDGTDACYLSSAVAEAVLNEALTAAPVASDMGGECTYTTKDYLFVIATTTGSQCISNPSQWQLIPQSGGDCILVDVNTPNPVVVAVGVGVGISLNVTYSPDFNLSQSSWNEIQQQLVQAGIAIDNVLASGSGQG